MNLSAYTWRFYFVAACLLGLLGALVAKVLVLQIIDVDRGYQFLQKQGDARAIRVERVDARRGMLLDRRGEPLAISTPVYSLWFDPRVLEIRPEQINQLSELLQFDSSKLSARLKAPKSRHFVYLQRHLPPSLAQSIMRLKVPGIFLERDYKRYYPAGEVSSHIAGFTDIDGAGQEGMELAFNSVLEPQAGSRQIITSLKGRTVGPVKELKEAKSGENIRLSIDLQLQHLAYKALQDMVVEVGASGGAFLVVDVASAEVLALVNQPAFNPNNRKNLQPLMLRNRVFTDEFEPGSTIKPFTILAALESGRYSPKSIIETSPGHIKVSGKLLKDSRDNGSLTLQQIITRSSQVGITKLALESRNS